MTELTKKTGVLPVPCLTATLIHGSDHTPGHFVISHGARVEPAPIPMPQKKARANLREAKALLKELRRR